MKGFIITGHGHFGTGLLSSINLIVGNPEKVLAVDFLESDTSETLKKKLTEAIETLQTKETLVLCDLLGGSPFKQAVELKNQHEGIEVVAGVNLPMIAENLYLRSHMDLPTLRDNCLTAGKNGIGKFELKVKKVETSDGI